MIVLVDMDGPLADFDVAFFAMCAREGIGLDCTLESQRHRFATDHIADRDQRARARRIVDAAGWFEQLPVTPGAVEGLNELANHADVWICTKPLDAAPGSASEKVRWVRRELGADWVRRLIITPDKSMVRGDILLDDAPLIRWLDDCLWQPVIFPAPWNRAGSDWADLPTWKWGDPVDDLLAHASGRRCTGITATWCPTHGDCTCPRRDDGELELNEGERLCPLHDESSLHGEGAFE